MGFLVLWAPALYLAPSFYVESGSEPSTLSLMFQASVAGVLIALMFALNRLMVLKKREEELSRR